MTTEKTSAERIRKQCESCSMTIDSGTYCEHCTDDNGALQPFEERLERFMSWTLREEPSLDPTAARQKTIEFMSTMPAWADHPSVKAALGS
jgi:hypothetical protein